MTGRLPYRLPAPRPDSPFAPFGTGVIAVALVAAPLPFFTGWKGTVSTVPKADGEESGFSR